jgi:tetratricopeptide (TPR) repeat protein
MVTEPTAEQGRAAHLREKRRLFWTLGVSLVILLSGSWSVVLAQEHPDTPSVAAQPEGQSPEESAAVRKFLAEQNPDEQIRLVEDFLLAFPSSRFKEYAFQAAMQAYQVKNDYARVLTYGELALQENEENLTALLVLASAIPEAMDRNDEDSEEKLAEAERYANRSLQVLTRMAPPPRMTPEEWAKARKGAEATAHASLGLIALIRSDFARAEVELREAELLSSRPDPILLYRLGLSYAFQKEYEAAIEVLDRASLLGGVKITGPDGATRDLVAEAKEFALKLRTDESSAPPRETPDSPGSSEDAEPSVESNPSNEPETTSPIP